MSNFMVDLETLGTKPGSVIIAIGATKFTSKGIHEEFYKVIDLDSCVKCGLTIDPCTVQWWMGQSDDARKLFAEKGDSLFNVLSEFSKFIGLGESERKIAKIWGNGSDFDNVLLAQAYAAVNLETPWRFYNNRCYRTMKNLYPTVKFERSGTAHNALDDAKSQTEHLIKILNGGA